MNTIDSLLEQLHDIEGLDAVPMWPFAIGWWIVIALGILLIGISLVVLIRWLRFKRSWKYDTLKKLNELQKYLSQPRITQEEIQHAVSVFSEYIRRIAVRRYSRNVCAGLSGDTWLQWLSQHDMKKFDWVQHGKLLTKAPYAPIPETGTADQLKVLIQAAKEWVR